MGHLHLSRDVPIKAEAIFQTIMKLEDYPSFVPYCADIQVISRDHGAPIERAEATMQVQFGPISQVYTSDVTADADTFNIQAVSHDGPFRQLHSEWRLSPYDDGCSVEFEARYDFKNPMIAAVASKAFEQAQAEIIDAFLNRASQA